MKSREELEELEKSVNDAAKELVLIDRTKDCEFFIKERRNFLNKLAELMQKTRPDFSKVGAAIIETASNCIKTYNSEHGLFLNYYNRSLKRAIVDDKIWEAKQQVHFPKITDKDGEEKSFDVIDKKIVSPEREIVIRRAVRIINLFFKAKQERTQAMLSKLLTIKMLEALMEFYSDEETLLQETVFVDREIFAEYLNKEGKNMPTARTIADQYGKAEQHASRIINNFMEKLKENDEFAELRDYFRLDV